MCDINSKIENMFDDIITTLSSSNELDADKVEVQFCKLLSQIIKLESSDKPLFYQYRHRYHLLHVTYLERINAIDSLAEEKDMLDHYAVLCKEFPLPEVIMAPSSGEERPGNSDNDNQMVDCSWEDLLARVTSLADLTDMNGIVNTVGEIHRSLVHLFKLEIRTLDEFVKLKQNCATIVNLFKALQIGELDEVTATVENTEVIEGVETNPNYLESITALIDFVIDSLENQQIYFANILLSDLPKLNTLLFGDVPQTTQCIRRRHIELVRIFHADKHSSNSVFDELMKHINVIRDQYLLKINSQLDNNEKIKYELCEGHKHYELSCKYKERCRHGNDPEFSVDQLERFASNEALWAFEHYRVALKSLGKLKNDDSEENILQRADILKNMGLMLRQAGNFEIEAQLYFVAGIYIITLSSMTTRLYNKLRELQTDFQRYQQILASNSANASNQTSQDITSRELVLCNTSTVTVREIHDETKVFLRETVLRQCIIRSTQLMDLSTAVDKLSLEKTTLNMSNSRRPMILPPLTGYSIFGAPSYFVYRINKLLHKVNLVKRNEKSVMPYITTEHGIRQKLNEIMKTAIDHYNLSENAKFIDSLSQPYSKYDRLMDIKRNTETISLEIRSDQFIRPLLKHGFRADKLAHIMVLVGEVCLRGLDFSDPKRKNPEHSALIEQSKILFQGVYDSKELREAAVKLDLNIERYHHAKYAKHAVKLTHALTTKDIQDSYNALYVQRLNGYCRLARLNYAIACLLATGKDNFERCKSTLKELKQMINKTHDNFFIIPDERIYALEDLLSAFGMDSDDDVDTVMLALPSSTEININLIQWIKTSADRFNACKCILPVHSDYDQLTMLDCLIPSQHHFKCDEFIQFVLNKNPITNERVSALLRKERITELSVWENKFRQNPTVFNYDAYLPLLSEFGNMIIHPCDIHIDSQRGPVFKSSKAVIDHTIGKTEPEHLFIVVRVNEDHISAIFTIYTPHLNKLHSDYNKLKVEDPRRIGILLEKALYYVNEAQRLDKRNHLTALSDWQRASHYYEQLLDMSTLGIVTTEQHKKIKLGYCQCLIKLHRYSRVNTHLKEMYFMKGMKWTSADLWLTYVQARRKVGDYKAAKVCIQRAKALEPNNPNIEREQKILDLRDRRQPIKEHVKFNTHASTLEDQKSWCNILSIDGGGIRGIIPAVWLMELERQIKQPISSMFHVIAGTSTGAIIAAALSSHYFANPGKPPYQAYNLVKLYQTKGHKVFTKNQSMFANLKANYLGAPRYSPEGKDKLFNQYFNNLKLSDTLTELVIPAVKAESSVTDIFSRHSAKKDLSKNFLLRDVLMCTTAAPTFFPQYSFNDTAYVDGGVHANNPAMIAYSHATKIYRETINNNRVRLLSLGTGDYIPDPLHPTKERNLLFWHQNSTTVLKALFDGPQNNIDMQLANIIGDNYYRWQVWLENPISLDDTRPENIERLIDLAYEQLEEMEGYDNNQRLGCLVEKLRTLD